jgi:hypothetical protein
MTIINFPNDSQRGEEFRKELSGFTAAVFEAAYNIFKDMCKTDQSREVFIDWWNGKAVFNEEYGVEYSKEDLEDGHDIILHAISKGFG